jgi:hypothetical protein
MMFPQFSILNDFTATCFYKDILDGAEYLARTCLEVVGVKYTASYTFADEAPPMHLNIRILEVRFGIG